MMMVTVFLSISNQMDFNLVQNRKGNCHHDQIPFNLKGNGKKVFSVCWKNSSYQTYSCSRDWRLSLGNPGGPIGAPLILPPRTSQSTIVLRDLRTRDASLSARQLHVSYILFGRPTFCPIHFRPTTFRPKIFVQS